MQGLVGRASARPPSLGSPPSGATRVLVNVWGCRGNHQNASRWPQSARHGYHAAAGGRRAGDRLPRAVPPREAETLDAEELSAAAPAEPAFFSALASSTVGGVAVFPPVPSIAGAATLAATLALAALTYVQRARTALLARQHAAEAAALRAAGAELEAQLQRVDRGWTKEKERVQRIKLEAASAAALATQRVEAEREARGRLSDELSEREHDVEALTQKLDAAKSRASELTLLLEEERQALATVRSEKAGIERALAQKTRQLGWTREEADATSKALDEAEAAGRALDAGLTEALARERGLKADLEASRAAVEELEEQLSVEQSAGEAARAELAALEDDLEDAQRGIRELEAALEAARAEGEAAARELASSRGACDGLRSRLESAQATASELRMERDRAAHEAQGARAGESAARAERDALAASLEEERRAREDAVAAVGTLQRVVRLAREEMEEAETAAEAARAELRAESAARAEAEARGAAVQRELTALAQAEAGARTQAVQSLEHLRTEYEDAKSRLEHLQAAVSGNEAPAMGFGGPSKASPKKVIRRTRRKKIALPASRAAEGEEAEAAPGRPVAEPAANDAGDALHIA